MSWYLTLAIELLFAFFLAGAGWAMAAPLARRLGLREMSWLETVCLGAVALVVTLACVGVVIALVPWASRRFLGLSTLVVLAAASVRALARGGWRAAVAAPLAERLYFGGYVALCVAALFLALFPVRIPASLPDGAYVAKQDILPVRVQYSTGSLPTDNSLPHVVSQYLLRGISFQQERPIMPGQEVTNRPILAALVYVPFGAAFQMPPPSTGAMPRFNYVGTSWPDFSALMSDGASYRVSQAIGICLNALLLLAAGALALRIGPASPVLAVCVLALTLTSPYVLFETYFTWPKAMAGFFVVLAWLATRVLRSETLAGATLGLAYLSHPYAIVFLAGHLLFGAGTELAQGRARGAAARLREWLRNALPLLVAFVVITLPWFVWSKWVLDIPSDLVAQNFFQPGLGWREFLWVRPSNVLNTFLPVHLLVYPFNVSHVVRVGSVNFAGAVGLVSLVALTQRLCVRSELRTQAGFWLWLVPCAMLVLIFSNQAVPALHGLQPLVFVGILAGTIHVWGDKGSRGWGLLFAAQALCNVLLLADYFKSLL